MQNTEFFRSGWSEACILWLNCKGDNVEINTRLPYVAIYHFCAYGDEAETIISEINQIYNTDSSKPTPEQAAILWYNIYV
jgi:hypothetical protein